MRRSVRAWTLGALLLFVLHAEGAATLRSGWGCASCPLGGTPVIGSDGVEYPNACVASCQGVAVRDGLWAQLSDRVATISRRVLRGVGAGGWAASQPPAAQPDQGFIAAQDELRVRDGHVSWQEMAAMAQQGYRFHARYQGVEGGPDLVALGRQLEARSGAEEYPPTQNAAQGVAMTFPEGNVYVQTQPPPQPKVMYTPGFVPSEGAQLHGPANGVTGRAHGRGLRGVIGKDDRVSSWGNTLPNRATIQIRYGTRPGHHARCTGALITPSVLLTAGHCVYSHHKEYGIGYFKQSSYEFYERTSKEEHALRLKVVVQQIITTRGWIEDQDNSYDVALIYLDKAIGDELGYFHTGYDCDRAKYEFYILGYPGENPELGLRFRSVCNVTTHRTCADKTMHHTCDTTAGESGSPMITVADNVIRAVHSCGITRAYNGAAMLRPAIYNLITAAWELTSKRPLPKSRPPVPAAQEAQAPSQKGSKPKG